ncbi:MAG TPA: helix-turn-helix domain-containing protein [Parafilimonas sp.]|nr:helix-turn-helix domain-containing protein [Parafilimonas sp.]
MIKNEKQYKISKKLLGEVIEKIGNTKTEKDYNIKRKLVAESLEDFKEDIENEIREYEKLKSGKSAVLKERSLSSLPDIIVEYKIANHLTHKEFAKILGLKEQQLQRYEAESFKTVSFQNLMKFLDLINLDLKIKETVIKPIRRNKTTA